MDYRGAALAFEEVAAVERELSLEWPLATDTFGCGRGRSY